MRPTPPPIVSVLRRHATYALTAFVIAALAFETAVPGAVLPFLDVMPLAIIAAIFLGYDAVRRPRSARMPWARTVGGIVLAALAAAAILLLREWSGTAGVAAAALLTAAIVSLAFWPTK